MTRLRLLTLVILAAGIPLGAETPPAAGQTEIRVNCPACEGNGKLVLVPPDHGQNRGRIESKGHWNVRQACTICKGKGRLNVFRTSMPPLTDGTPPCPGCGWTGVDRCRKCSATGIIRCKAPDCKNGWIITKYPTSTSKNVGSKHMKVSVVPCSECKGLGKIVCPDCEGRRATACRKCNGLGRGKEKK